MSEQPLDYEGMLVALWHSWEVHRQAFGPILEPAFTENPQARVLLINALNHISRRRGNIRCGFRGCDFVCGHGKCGKDSRVY